MDETFYFLKLIWKWLCNRPSREAIYRFGRAIQQRSKPINNETIGSTIDLRIRRDHEINGTITETNQQQFDDEPCVSSRE